MSKLAFLRFAPTALNVVSAESQVALAASDCVVCLGKRRHLQAIQMKPDRQLCKRVTGSPTLRCCCQISFFLLWAAQQRNRMFPGHKIYFVLYWLVPFHF